MSSSVLEVTWNKKYFGTRAKQVRHSLGSTTGMLQYIYVLYVQICLPNRYVGEGSGQTPIVVWSQPVQEFLGLV